MIKSSKSRFSLLLSLRTVLFALVLGYSTSASGQLTLNTSFNSGVTDGNSNGNVAAVQSDGKVLVGGNFGFANGIEKFGLARLNSDGTVDTSFNAGGSGPNGIVYDIKVLSDGKIVIGGGFGTYNGTTKQAVARLNSDGTLDTSFNNGGVGGSGTVQTIVIQSDGKYLLTGSGLSAYNGTAKFSVIRVNADGTLDTGFTSPFTGPQFVEQPGLQTDGKIVIAGQFSVGAYNNLARLNTDGSLDTTFNSGGSGPNGGVFAVAVQSDNKILAGGAFTGYNGVATPMGVRLNSNGTLDGSFTASMLAGAQVEYLLPKSNGQYLVAGMINTINAQYPLVLLNADGTQDATFTPPQADNIGYQITMQPDGKILLAGFFANVEVLGGLTHRDLVRLNANGTVDSSFNSPLSTYGSVGAMLQQPDGKYVTAGNFNSANGTGHTNIARFNADGTIDNTFQSGYGLFNNGNVIINALGRQSDGKILLGGNFNSYNLNDAPSLVRINTDGSQDMSFNPIGISAGTPGVNDILVQPDSKILVAGAGLDIGIQALVRLNADGTGDNTFAPGNSNGQVQKVLRQSDGKLIVMGNFTNYLGARNRIVRLNTDGTVDGTFTIGTGANSPIFTAAFQADGKVIIAGAFTAYNGTTRNHIARLNADGTLDATFNPNGGTNGNIVSLAIQPDGKIVIVGGFSTYNGVNRVRMARVNPEGSLDTTADSGLTNDFRVSLRRVMLTADNQILIGGQFTNYGGTPRNSIAKLLTSTPNRPPFDFDGDGKTDIGIVRPNNGATEWWISRSSDSNVFATVFGLATDIPAPGDFTGDGKADIAVFRPSNGNWFILRSEDFTFLAFPFGANGDIPMPADYDGDGKTDPAVFRPSSSTWFISRTSDSQTTIAQFGQAGDQPVAADYDGDGKADIAIYRLNNGAQEWWIQRSTAGLFATVFGVAGDKAVQGDYTGDGKADIAVWRPSNGNWFILRSEDFSFLAFPWGANGDIPAPGDYDGDGKFDAAVFRPSAASWFINRTGESGPLITNFGAATDKPVAGVFVR